MNIGEQDQNNIIRTNCIDCLDRTNKMQYYIGREKLLSDLVNSNVIERNKYINFVNQCRDRKLMADEVESELNLTVLDNKLVSGYLKNFRNMYEDLGNNLSLQYAGTSAMSAAAIGVESRNVGRSIQDLFSGIKRYFVNRYGHDNLQNAYEIVSGCKTKGVLKNNDSNIWLFARLCLIMILFHSFLFRVFKSKKLGLIYKLFVVFVAIFVISILFPIKLPSQLY